MKMNRDLKDTIISPLTPSVGGSVALIRISGPEAISRCNQFFRSKNLERIKGNQFVFGSLVDESAKMIDQVVILVYRAPHSYTGEDTVEISCHANPFIVNEILQLFTRHGCRLAEPGEFSKRAFLNEKMDLVQAEAVADLIAAKSKAAVENSLNHLKGELSRYVQAVKKELIEISALVELDLDFTEEDLEIIPPEPIIRIISNAEGKLEKLLKSYSQGTILKKGIEVLITGKPNVGKSSLMNALLKKNRVIVSEYPGTTRDVVHEETILNQVLVRFIDSAGIRFTDQIVESEGIEKAKEYFDQAQVILLVVDGSSELTHDDINLIQSVSATFRSKVILVVNKTDLQTHPETIRYIEKRKMKNILVSAKKATNIDKLKDMIIEHVYTLNQKKEEELLLSNERQKQSIEKALTHLRRTREGVLKGIGNELVAIDLREAINELAEVTGEITTDDVLNTVFANFCIGK